MAIERMYPNYYVIWASGSRDADPDAFTCAEDLKDKLQACGWDGDFKVPGTSAELDSMVKGVPPVVGKLVIYVDDQVHLISGDPMNPGVTDQAGSVYPLSNIGNDIQGKYAKVFIVVAGPRSGLAIDDIVHLIPPDPEKPRCVITSMDSNEQMIIDEFNLGYSLDPYCDILGAAMDERDRLMGIQKVLIKIV
jgi:hypothetical protein